MLRRDTAVLEDQVANDRQGLIDWREWRDLRWLADRGFLKAIAGAHYHRI